jgi:hypothetical protein
MRSSVTQILLSIAVVLVAVSPFTLGQTLLLPAALGYARGEGKCADLAVAIANRNWRVRKGDSFDVWAAHPSNDSNALSYKWTVTNAKILSGQGTSRIRLKAGGAKTPGYINLTGLVVVELLTTRNSDECSVRSNLNVMVGRNREFNQLANVNDVLLDESTVVRPPVPGARPREGAATSPDMILDVSTSATDPENDVLTYNYSVTGGKIVGSGAQVKWDLTGLPPGTYSIVVGVDDGFGMLGRTVAKEITVLGCPCIVDTECPTITILGPDLLEAESAFTARVSGGTAESVTYEWTVENGEIREGQGTESVRVRLPAKGTGKVRVKIGRMDPAANCVDSAEQVFVDGVLQP